MGDSSVTDSEVLAWTAVLDALPNNTVGDIGATDVRAIVKSMSPRYFELAVEGYNQLWSGSDETPVVLPDQAANHKAVGNGFALDGNGAIVYNGTIPLLVNLSFGARFVNDSNVTVRLRATHTNALDNISESIYDVYANSADSPSGAAMARAESQFTISSGSSIVMTREIENGTPDASSWSIDAYYVNILAHPLVPATVETRSGTFGSVATAGAIFSVLPFTELRRITAPSASNEDAGVYGFNPAADPTHVYVSNGSAWSSTAPMHHDASNAPTNGTGANGDFYLLGEPSASTGSVYGPKADGYWPTYPRTVTISNEA